MTNLTANCQICHKITYIRQIHFGVPIILVLDCNHKVELHFKELKIYYEVGK